MGRWDGGIFVNGKPLASVLAQHDQPGAGEVEILSEEAQEFQAECSKHKLYHRPIMTGGKAVRAKEDKIYTVFKYLLCNQPFNTWIGRSKLCEMLGWKNSIVSSVLSKIQSWMEDGPQRNYFQVERGPEGFRWKVLLKPDEPDICADKWADGVRAFSTKKLSEKRLLKGKADTVIKNVLGRAVMPEAVRQPQVQAPTTTVVAKATGPDGQEYTVTLRLNIIVAVSVEK